MNKARVSEAPIVAMKCVVCASAPAVSGVLCEPCTSRVCGATALCPEQIDSSPRRREHVAALVDRWGRTHAIGSSAVVGRQPGPEGVAIAEPSVSRRHAVVEKVGDGWRVRDLESANGTRVAGRAVQGAASIRSGDVVAFADVAFFFLAARIGPAVDASDSTTLRPPVLMIDGAAEYEEREETFSGLRRAEMEVLEPAGGGAGVLVLDGKTAQLTLGQYELLATLARRMAEEGTIDERVRGFVRSSELLASLSWDTARPDDNHLKQLVRRARRALARAGIADVIESRHGFGYRLRIVPYAPKPDGRGG